MNRKFKFLKDDALIDYINNFCFLKDWEELKYELLANCFVCDDSDFPDFINLWSIRRQYKWIFSWKMLKKMECESLNCYAENINIHADICLGVHNVRVFDEQNNNYDNFVEINNDVEKWNEIFVSCFENNDSIQDLKEGLY